MNLDKKLQLTLIWTVSLLCFFTGLYIAINHTWLLFSPYNYLFSPLGDDGIDSAKLLYPIILKQKSIISIFHFYGDHRLVVARLQAILEFFFAEGTQKFQPYRMAFVFWLNFLIFVKFILLPNRHLDAVNKLLLSGLFLILFFSGITIFNYGSTYMLTWPWIFLFSLSAFIFTDKYCAVMLQSYAKIQPVFYIWLTFISVNLALYTFAIGVILWPIILFILFKRLSKVSGYQKFQIKNHNSLWIGCVLLTYGIYFFKIWQVSTSGNSSFMQSICHPIELFNYISRILSVPIVISAAKQSSFASFIMGFIIFIMTIWFLVVYLKKPVWSSSETLLFSLIVFGLSSVVVISLARFWMPQEAYNVVRFTTPGFILICSLICSLFIFQTKSTHDLLFSRTAFSIGITMMMLVVFIPQDIALIGELGVYDQTYLNQYLIAESTGIPIDESFKLALGKVQNLDDVASLNYLHDVQKQNKKGVYSLWPTQYIKQNIADLHFSEISIDKKAVFHITEDFRAQKNPGVLIDLRSENENQQLTKQWSVFFTNTSGKIVGFAVSSIFPQQLMDKLLRKGPYRAVFWRGAINASLLNNDGKIIAWAVDERNQRIGKMGELVI